MSASNSWVENPDIEPSSEATTGNPKGSKRRYYSMPWVLTGVAGLSESVVQQVSRGKFKRCID